MTPAAPISTPRRADAYEKQLSDGELLGLHQALNDAKLPLDRIRLKAPVWREGRFAGKPPSIGTLHNIRTRLELEEDLREVEATTETILDELKKEQPGLDQATLDDFGMRTFMTLAIQRRDLKGFVALQRARKDRDSLELDEAKFQRETCELFIKWAQDQRASEIANSGASHGDKIAALGQLMFGEDWKA